MSQQPNHQLLTDGHNICYAGMILQRDEWGSVGEMGCFCSHCPIVFNIEIWSIIILMFYVSRNFYALVSDCWNSAITGWFAIGCKDTHPYRCLGIGESRNPWLILSTDTVNKYLQRPWRMNMKIYEAKYLWSQYCDRVSALVNVYYLNTLISQDV